MSDEMKLSIGGESVPFTMQAEVGHMTMDDAIASGLFDLPDEPGMVRIPVSLKVLIPNNLLDPPARAPDPASSLGVPPSRRRHTRFGNYPKAIAAQNVARSFQTPAQADAERDKFRGLLSVLHPPRGPQVPDGTPNQRAPENAPET